MGFNTRLSEQFARRLSPTPPVPSRFSRRARPPCARRDPPFQKMRIGILRPFVREHHNVLSDSTTGGQADDRFLHLGHA